MRNAFLILAFLSVISFPLAVTQSKALSTSNPSVKQPALAAPTPAHLSPIQSPQLLAQQSRVRRLQFAPGAYSATREDAVVRGTRDIYLVGASQGQTMTVKIVSLENNASFALLAPPNKAGQRRSLTPDAVTWSGVLPASGDYQVTVGSSRGNASYKLQVTIK
jgi:hypothetical protein